MTVAVTSPLPHQLGPRAGQYSLLRLIQNLAFKGSDPDSLEDEVAREITRRDGSPRHGTYIPMDVRHLPETRDLTAATGAGAVAAVRPTVAAETLRSRLVTARLGAQTIEGLRGTATVAVSTSGCTASWASPSNAPPESNPVFEGLALTPLLITASVDISTTLMQLSGGTAEALVRRDIFGAFAAAVDRAALVGDGAAEPYGLLRRSAIPVVSLGTDGGPLSWAKLCEMERIVGDNDGEEGPMGFVTSPAGRAALRQTQRTGGGGPAWQQNRVLDYPAWATTSIPADFTQGAGTGLTAALLGDWSSLLVGIWGTAEIVVDPRTVGQGFIRVSGFLSVDVAVRHPESFVRVVDVNPAA